MTINNILILGSTRLTELCINKLEKYYNLVGYIPSVNPTVEGNINLPITDVNTECDIKLSIQYDRIIKDTDKSFNVHTGLLPEYGGTNILDYAILNKSVEQGLTFHKMTEKLDYGPIISKITYPILDGDTSFDLYKRLITIGPNFVLSAVKMLENLSEEEVNECFCAEPTIYKRGEFKTNTEWKI